MRTRIAISLLLLASGCAVGPDFKRPAPPPVTGFTATEIPGTLTPGFGEAEQRFVGGDALSADWWELFRSAELSDVVRQAISLVGADASSLAGTSASRPRLARMR